MDGGRTAHGRKEAGWQEGGRAPAGIRMQGLRQSVASDNVASKAALWLLSGHGNGVDLNVRRRVGSANKDGARQREQGFGGGDWMARQR
jgi:hypothetical protein